MSDLLPSSPAAAAAACGRRRRWGPPPLLVALVAVVLSAEGDIQLALALRTLPSQFSLAAYVSHAPLWFAVALLAGHFFSWLYVLSCLELSVAVPLLAGTYVFNALLAPWQLGESMSPRRWLGTLVLTLGVVLVSRSSHASVVEPPEEEEPCEPGDPPLD